MENSDTPNSEIPEANSLEPHLPQNFSTPPLEGSSISNPSKDLLSTETGFQHFDPRNISVEKIAGGIFTGIVGIAALVAAVVLYFAYGLGWIFYCSLAAALFCYVILFYFTIFWPSVEHRHRRWRLTDVGLEVRHGVWWKHMQAIPWARVQHADVSQGPVQRMYGVGTLTVHTAGTSNSSVNLGGLSHEVAIELRDEIIRQRASGDVV